MTAASLPTTPRADGARLAWLRRELAPVPGRSENAVRITVTVVLVVIISMALRVPEARRMRDFKDHVFAAATLLQQGQAPAALPRLQAALELQPDHSEALWLLAWAELQQGDLETARIHAERSLEQRPDSQEAAKILATVKARTGR